MVDNKKINEILARADADMLAIYRELEEKVVDTLWKHLQVLDRWLEFLKRSNETLEKEIRLVAGKTLITDGEEEMFGGELCEVDIQGITDKGEIVGYRKTVLKKK